MNAATVININSHLIHLLIFNVDIVYLLIIVIYIYLLLKLIKKILLPD